MYLDAASLYFRAYYGVPDAIVSPDGKPVNAVRGFLDMVATLVTTYRPSRLVACMDADWRPAWRVSALPSYKAHRVAPDGAEEVPDLLSPQVPVLEAALDAVGIARIGIDGYEADDVIGTLTASTGDPVDIVTGDRDLFQLVRDDRPVRVLYTARGVRRMQIVDEAEITSRYGIPGRAYADFALLRGDPSDGLPGVSGIGDKTAAALLARFGSVAGIRAALASGEADGFPAGARRRLLEATDYLDRAPVVVAVACDAPLPAYDDRLPAQVVDPSALVELSTRWGLDSSFNRLLTAFGLPAARAERSAD